MREHAAMPALTFGPVVRAQASKPRLLEGGHHAMPGLRFGPDPVVRASARAPRRHGESGYYFMPGLRLERSAD